MNNLDENFDAFFIGDVSYELLKREIRHVNKSYSNQLIDTIIKNDAACDQQVALDGSKWAFDIKNDISEYEIEHIIVNDIKEIEKIFELEKKIIFESFDFIRIRSENLGSIPMKERDLILNELDIHTIKYISDKIDDYHTISSIAKLMAYKDMGIEEVKFIERDGCMICKAFDGVITNIDYYLDSLMTGNTITHSCCECNFMPVIKRNVYKGFLNENVLNKKECLNINGVKLYNTPTELLFIPEFEYLISLLKSKNTEVVFENLYKFCINVMEEVVENKEDLIIVQYCDKLYIHNSYIDGYGPLDFIKSYIGYSEKPDVLEKEVDGEIFYVNGSMVIRHNGEFWDFNTRERLK